jgi:uncharacterized protein (DUF1697 family)
MDGVNNATSAAITTRYAAFLRGINVGGHRKIKMTDLAAKFVEMEFTDVRTVIASGNVIFSSSELNVAKITSEIEAGLVAGLGYPVNVMVRTVARLREMIALDPFKSVAGEEGHRYVSFMQSIVREHPDLPYDAGNEGFRILAVHGEDVFILSQKLPDGRHGDPGKYIVKHFGKVSTMRNWNTVVKIAAL